jgi:hypothetical protein
VLDGCGSCDEDEGFYDVANLNIERIMLRHVVLTRFYGWLKNLIVWFINGKLGYLYYLL